MTADQHITDPLLLSVLASAAQAREQSLQILDLIEQFHSPSPTRDPDHDNNTDNADEQALLTLSKYQKRLNTHLARLRGLDRKAILGVRTTKQETAEARQEIDSLHLQLQNLYYEQRHLRGEIGACEDYEHDYTQIQMEAVDTFLELHPQYTDATEHDLTIARIEDEHAQRVVLEEQKQKLISRKEALIKETAAKKDELGRLDGEMERWVGGQESVRRIFEAREKTMADVAEKIAG